MPLAGTCTTVFIFISHVLVLLNGHRAQKCSLWQGSGLVHCVYTGPVCSDGAVWKFYKTDTSWDSSGERKKKRHRVLWAVVALKEAKSRAGVQTSENDDFARGRLSKWEEIELFAIKDGGSGSSSLALGCPWKNCGCRAGSSVLNEAEICMHFQFLKAHTSADFSAGISI